MFLCFLFPPSPQVLIRQRTNLLREWHSIIEEEEEEGGVKKGNTCFMFSGKGEEPEGEGACLFMRLWQMFYLIRICDDNIQSVSAVS